MVEQRIRLDHISGRRWLSYQSRRARPSRSPVRR
jgi:hypothetical protein